MSERKVVRLNHLTRDEEYNPEGTFKDALSRLVSKLKLKKIDTYNEQYLIRVTIEMEPFNSKSIGADEEE